MKSLAQQVQTANQQVQTAKERMELWKERYEQKVDITVNDPPEPAPRKRPPKR